MSGNASGQQQWLLPPIHRRRRHSSAFPDRSRLDLDQVGQVEVETFEAFLFQALAGEGNVSLVVGVAFEAVEELVL